MKHIKHDTDPRPVTHPLVGLTGWDQKIKNSTFSEQCHVADKIKGITNAEAW